MLPRPSAPLPPDVRRALESQGLLQAFASRPPYQRLGYLGWIDRAPEPEVRRRRVRQVLGELATGGVYMGLWWGHRRPERRPVRRPRRGNALRALVVRGLRPSRH